MDKSGTATAAVIMPQATSVRIVPEPPLEIRLDRPCAFAIQHRESGACLCLSRVTDPR